MVFNEEIIINKFKKLIKMKAFKVMFLFVAATTLLVGCAKDDVPTTISYEDLKAMQPRTVDFNSYFGEQAVTRSLMDNTALQASGFGVFAYFTNNTFYPGSNGGTNENAALAPNFMYNQQVTYASSKWGYEPVKYWPNETLNDGNGATSESSRIGRVSFFAYAPYKSVTASTGAPATAPASGITALTTNGATGDPKVTYKTGTSLDEEDLVWAVADPSNNVTWNTVHKEGTTVQSVTVNKGMPFVNLYKPATDATIDFHFRHALAALKLTVQGAYDEASPGSTNKIDDNTHINIEQIKITASLPKEGVLNLNNITANTPKWEINTAASNFEDKVFTIDKDNGLLENLQYDSSVTAVANLKPGVGRDTSGTLITAAQEVIAAAANSNPQYFMFIPTASATDFTVEITYHVWTADAALAGGFAKVKNVITKTVSLSPAGGKIYTLNMILGMTTVKLDATVENWDTGSTTVIDLPKNQ